MTGKNKKILSMAGTVFFTILSVLWMYPIFMVVINSLKVERSITTEAAFTLPNAETLPEGTLEQILRPYRKGASGPDGYVPNSDRTMMGTTIREQV
jgi:ABC-type glycerol-3-phosphate transport system permease component